MKRIVGVAMSLLLGACALPETVIKTGSSRPQLVVKGAPADTVLVVDGHSMGSASRFNGDPNVLVVEPGGHQVEIQRSGNVVHVEKVFVSDGETRTITINAGRQ